MTQKLNIVEDENKRITFLENLVKSVIREKVEISDSGTKVKMSVGELKNLIACEGELMMLRRKLRDM